LREKCPRKKRTPKSGRIYTAIAGILLTFVEYLQLSNDDRIPIDNLVKEQTVARLIVKDSLNDMLHDHLITSFSTGDDCYPNTINDALSLLSTFIKTKKDAATEDIVVSYHESTERDDVIEDKDIIEDEDTIPDDHDIIVNDINDVVNDDIEVKEEESHDNHVTFNATVMASVINEATADADEDLFIGASFAQLQEVDDVYEDDAPDIVCYAHIVDTSDVLDFDDGDEPEFVAEANTNAEEHNERVRDRSVTLTRHPVYDDIKDFELLIYHTAQRVLHKAPRNVGIYHYVPGCADLISLTCGWNIPESIIDYSGALLLRFWVVAQPAN
jgi:hypothetical protein